MRKKINRLLFALFVFMISTQVVRATLIYQIKPLGLSYGSDTWEANFLHFSIGHRETGLGCGLGVMDFFPNPSFDFDSGFVTPGVFSVYWIPPFLSWGGGLSPIIHPDDPMMGFFLTASVHPFVYYSGDWRTQNANSLWEFWGWKRETDSSFWEVAGGFTLGELLTLKGGIRSLVLPDQYAQPNQWAFVSAGIGVGGWFSQPTPDVTPTSPVIPSTHSSEAKPTPIPTEAEPTLVPPEEPTQTPTVTPTRVPPPIPVPPADEKKWILFNKNGIQDHAKAEIYSQNGGGVTATLMEWKKSRTVKRFSQKFIPGVYGVIVKNPDGSYSRTVTFTLPDYSQMSPLTLTFEPAKPVTHCAGKFSQEPKNIFLGGGMAASLFDGYLNLEGNDTTQLPSDIKIIYFKLEKGQLERKEIQADVLRAALMEHEQLLKYLKKQLGDPKAEIIPDIETHSDYYQCVIGPAPINNNSAHISNP